MRCSRTQKIYCSLECNFQGHLKETNAGCIEWTGHRQGRAGYFDYGVIRHRGQEIRAHRFSWERTHGKIKHGLVVMHTCDNPPCVNVEHLSVGTQAANVADAARKQRMPRGEAKSKLTEADVLTIRRCALTETHVSIAARYGVASQTIDRIVLRQRWGWLRDHQEEPGPPPHR